MGQKNLEKRVLFNSETGRAAGKKSALKRSVFRDAQKCFLNGPNMKNASQAVAFWRSLGFKNVPPGLFAWTKTMQEAIKHGNYKALESFFKVFGIHFDSNKEQNINCIVDQRTEHTGELKISFNEVEPKKIDEEG